MDTKSKNFRYSMLMKAIAVFLMWLSFAGLFSSAFYLARYSEELNSKDYRTINHFISEFGRYADSAYEFAVNLKSESNIKSAPIVIIQPHVIEDEAQNNQEEIEAIQKEKINNNLRLFKNYQKQLNEAKNFEYIVVDTNTGSFTTNIKETSASSLQGKIDRLKKQPFNVHFSKADLETSYQDYSGYFSNLEQEFSTVPYEMYAAVIEPLEKDGEFYGIWYEYTKVHELIPFFIVLSSISGLLFIASFIYLIVVAGRRERRGQVYLCFIDSIYTDVQTLLLIGAAMISVGIVQSRGFHNSEFTMGITVFANLTVDFFIGLTYILSMTRHIKNRTLFRHTLIYTIAKAIIRLTKKCMGAKTFRISVLLLLLAYGVLNSILCAYIVRPNRGHFFLFLLLWAALNIAAVWFVSKSLVSLSEIMKWVKRISSGGLEEKPDMKELSLVYQELAEDVLNIQSGLKNAVSEAVKGERLKAELITNVSHDLKTPLTSIINYVDLLKKEETDNENILQYTGVLEEKASRLKQLIDDLLEASKAASGNMSVNLESIDMHALLLQATAEFNDKATDAGLELRIKPVEKATLIHADGRLMWRIMENLFSNVLKYSQKNSRVYLDIESSGEYGVITIKNISESPLDISSDQLMERFVRGDRSRTTEGSGLGLAIAKSLAEVQNGKLEITIDGDLFKVSVMVPLEKS